MWNASSRGRTAVPPSNLSLLGLVRRLASASTAGVDQ
jgi:hypothetical protein